MWLYVPHTRRGQTSKLYKPWQGPYKVIKKISDVTYRIQSVTGRKRQVVHFNRWKPCSQHLPDDRHDQTAEPCRRTEPTPIATTRQQENTSQLQQRDRLLAKRTSPNSCKMLSWSLEDGRLKNRMVVLPSIHLTIPCWIVARLRLGMATQTMERMKYARHQIKARDWKRDHHKLYLIRIN